LLFWEPPEELRLWDLPAAVAVRVLALGEDRCEEVREAARELMEAWDLEIPQAA
jgi:hypothetical protein